MKKFQFPLALIALIGMIFVWKSVIEHYFPDMVHSNVSPTTITAVKVKGDVTLEAGDKTFKVKEGQIIKDSVSLSTAQDAILILGYGEGFSSKIKIGPNSKLDLTRYKLPGSFSGQGVHLDLSSGRLLLKIFNPSGQKVVRVKTPNFSMGIKETTSIVETFNDNSLLLVKEGTVEVEAEGKTRLAKAGSGFLSNNGAEIKPIQIKNYKVDWDVESMAVKTQTADAPKAEAAQPVQIDTTQISVPLKIEEELIKLQKQIENHQTELPARQAQLKEQDKKYDEELARISQDEQCLENSLRDCEFTSEAFKYHPSNLKNNPSHLSLNANSKASLQKDMTKAKDDVAQKKSLLKADSDVLENELQIEKDKLKNATAKYEQSKTADEATKNTIQLEVLNMLRE